MFFFYKNGKFLGCKLQVTSLQFTIKNIVYHLTNNYLHIQKEYSLIYLSYKNNNIYSADHMQIKILQTVVFYKIEKLDGHMTQVGQTPFKICPCKENPQNKITFNPFKNRLSWDLSLRLPP